MLSNGVCKKVASELDIFIVNTFFGRIAHGSAVGCISKLLIDK
jgi:hypothetical protein